MNSNLRKFRNEYDATVPRLYNGPVHGIWTLAICLTSAGIAIKNIGKIDLLSLVIMATTFLLGNLIEYSLHRFPLHSPMPGLKLLYKRHTLEHHGYFPFGDTDFENSRQLAIVLFPWWAPILAVLFVTLLGRYLIMPYLGTDPAHSLIATGSLYFLFYETFHTYHHLPLKKNTLPIFSTSRTRHLLHHDPQHMSTENFNVTVPIFDFLLGTKRGS